jgi:alkanesulfonate monooxygenase SsuD/methylene tetrahydromethanopterin reductase-like flavin-dependent oxidoreductase (luciferase family)
MLPIQFGYCVPIFAWPGARYFRTPNYPHLDVAVTMGLARHADALGYDSLWVADHLMLGRDQAILEGWTVLAALAGSTQRARLGMIHQGHFFRSPSLAAKMTATLDQISGGRFIYFVDAGFNRAEHHAYDLFWPDDLTERIMRVVDGLRITLALWQADTPVSVTGEHYRVVDAVCTPLPVQRPHPPVWFGEAHPLTLEATARFGQGWNTTPATVAQVKAHLAELEAACRAVGRDHAEIEKCLETQVLIAADRAELRAQLQAMHDLDPSGGQANPELAAFLAGETDDVPAALAELWLIGTPDEIAARIHEYIDCGITHFMLWFMDAPNRRGMEQFAHEIAPRFR